MFSTFGFTFSFDIIGIILVTLVKSFYLPLGVTSTYLNVDKRICVIERCIIHYLKKSGIMLKLTPLNPL